MFPPILRFDTLAPGVFVPFDPWATPPSSVLAGMLGDHETGDQPFDRLERLGAWEKLVGWAQACQAIELAQFVDAAAAAPPPGWDGAEAVESAEAEVALKLRVTTRTAGARADEAREWVHRYPATLAALLAALLAGSITVAKARILADGLSELEQDAAAAAEQELLARAGGQTPGQLREAVRRAVLRADPDAARRRQQRKRRERKVVLYPERDGMATLSAAVPAAEAVGMWAVLDQHARACAGTDGRSMDARRVDTLVDLVLGETGFSSAGTAATADDSDTASGSADTGSADTGSADTGSAGPNITDNTAAAENTAAGRVGSGGGGGNDDSDGSGAEPGESYPGERADAKAGTADRAAWGRWLTRNHTTDRDPASLQAEEDRLFSRTPTRAGPTRSDQLEPGPDPARLPGVARPGGGAAGPGKVAVQVRVTVPLHILMGSDDAGAELAGYGPITAEQARALAFDADSVWRRLVTDPLSGALLDVGTQRYRPSQHLAEHVVSRHSTCQFPGCRTPAHRCDLDHNVPFDHTRGEGGATSSRNLGPKCRPHHRIKGMPGWDVTQYADGTIVWRTPSGHRYTVEPPPVGPVRATAPAPPPPVPDDTPPPF